ncbi:MAG: nitroreductase family protein [Pseudomonadota bacterium]
MPDQTTPPSEQRDTVQHQDVRLILDRLAARASCRAFDGSSIAPEILEEIVRDGLQAPSSCNHQNWHFIVVTEAEAKQRAHDIAGGNPHFLECSALIYLCFQKGWTHGNFSIVQSVAGAAYHMLLSAHLRGFHGIWNAGIGDHRALRDLLALPQTFEVQGALAIGRPRPEAPSVKAPRRPPEEVISWERFSRPPRATYPAKPAPDYPFFEIRNDANPFAEWDPRRWTWAQLADFRGYAVWAKSPLAGVYVSRRQGDAQDIEHALLPKIAPDAHVVEVMPWGGTSSTALAGRIGQAALTIAELSPHNLSFIEARLKAEGIDMARVRHALMSGPTLPLSDESADVVVLPQVLEHVPDPKALLRDAARVLKPGGAIVLSVRNAESAYGAHWRAHEARGQVPNQGPFTPLAALAVRDMVGEHFELEEVCGIGRSVCGDAERREGDDAYTGRLFAARARAR